VSVHWSDQCPIIKTVLLLGRLMLFCFAMSAVLGKVHSLLYKWPLAIRGAMRALSVMSGIVAILILTSWFVVAIGWFILFAMNLAKI
jgi:hypothetical protein